jgi:hypothetical protein
VDRVKAARLADFIAVFRPAWNMREVTDEIAGLTGASDAVIAHYVIGLVQDSETRYPARIGLRWNAESPELTNSHKRSGNSEPCDICGRSEWQCNKVIKNRAGDGHTYSVGTHRPVTDIDLVAALEAAGGIGRPV